MHSAKAADADADPGEAGAQAQGAAGVALNRCFLRPTDDFLPES